MSARALRKVLKEQEEKQRLAALKDAEADEDDLDSPEPAATSRINVFDLLDDGGDEQEEEPEIEGNFAKSTQKKEIPRVKISVDDVPPLDHNTKKKKKKKKAKESSAQVSVKKEKPLDIILKELSLDSETVNRHHAPSKGKASVAKDQSNLSKQSRSLVLAVDPKLLRPENELKRIFGSKVVSSFENTNQAGSSRQMRGGRRTSHIMRKTILVAPSDGWSIWDRSLSMEHLETKDGIHYFRYLHSPDYEQAQRAYEVAKNLHDLNVVYSILVDYPYHLDSLLAISEYFKLVGEQQLAANAISKCLYALECAWHPLFTPLQGNCQLKFIHETNKPFFKILFTHMKNTDRRGCHRVALEICKLLLSLDPDDPMGAMFCIDYYALRAEQYTWLEQFSEEYGNDNSIWLFPNFSYSLAVCRFFLDRDDQLNEDTDTGKASSAELMKQALMLHPSVLKKLVAKVPLKDQIWKTILKNSFFNVDQSGSPTLDHLIDIYVERSYLIWRLPDLQNLLKDSALLVIEVLKQSRSEAEDWACVRTETFSSEKNEYSHLLVSDFSDTVSTIPPEELQNLMGGGPGMIPQGARLPQGIAMADNEGVVIELPQGNRVPRDVANRNPLAVLFESMLPWVDYGGGEEAHIEDNEDQ
uniref:Transcription factor 25 n=1 Tax=Kalanchoe fedtschenkoi TaxID=63787 RepID=A0A7N0UR90_KALFE